jgi:hypothetical protein
MKITTTIDIKQKDIETLLCTAFEGGSNYWIDCIENLPSKDIRKKHNVEYFHECPVRGLSFDVVNEQGTRTLTPESLDKGMQLMADMYPHHFTDVIEENSDAITADVFLQLCLFGEVIYG